MPTLFGQCDCCEKKTWLRYREAYGMDTFACAECCGCEPDEFDPVGEPCEFCGEDMDRALAADGAKLRQLTGKDHGPWRIVACECCGGEGRLLTSNGGPDEIDNGPCPACEGTGSEIIAVEPITIDDLRD